MYRRYRRRNAFGGLYSILWILIIVIFVLTGFHFWQIFLIGALLSAILGILIRLITAGAIGAGLFGAATMLRNQQQPPQYQPPYQPYQQPGGQPPYYQPPPQPPYQPYEQGYQPPPQAPGTYQQSGQPYYQPSQQQPQYEQPQVQYPEEMPPQ